ncbi:MAG: hypothetical protein EBS89_08410, partial [Proteobacteria bacterium]|nr:hypothetical protein [Pseudomonadota bacterium]
MLQSELYTVMSRLSFRHFLEMANYGHDTAETSHIMGGTEQMKGDALFAKFNPNLIIEELVRLPPISTHEAVQIWDESVQWGTEAGAIRVSASPLGSLRLMTRRLTHDLLGEQMWVCKGVLPIRDYRDQHKEVALAHEMHESLERLSREPLEAPVPDYDGTERLAWRLWHTTKKRHPSYIMFPVSLRKQDENYYKLVYEFRGQGAGSPYNGKTGRSEQFNIDLVYYPKSGFLRCLGYDIDSPRRTTRTGSWRISSACSCNTENGAAIIPRHRGGTGMRHFLSVSDFGRDEIERVLGIATEIERSWCHCRQMNNKCIASFFAEPSTRTRFSFERAMHWLGGRIVTAADASSSSSLTKGESLKDTIRTLGQYADAIVMRHPDSSWPEVARAYSRVPVINAGSGSGEHPTQALLDLHTIKQKWRSIEGLKVMFCGDLKNGRTVH